MNGPNKTVDMEQIRLRLSTLWIVVLFNIVFADILSFITPRALEEIMTGSAGGLQVTQGLLLVFAALLEIPIVMIYLARVLPHRVNRPANIGAAAITILFVVGGGSASLHYIFFAGIEVLCLLLIVWYAWSWSDPQA
jgi:hypothetical protein